MAAPGPNVDRLRARILWCLAKLQLQQGTSTATLPMRTVATTLELSDPVHELPNVLQYLPQDVCVQHNVEALVLQVVLHADDALEVAHYWRQATGRDKRTELTAKRVGLIRARLRSGRTVAELKLAVDRCMASAWHTGQNPSGTVYTDCQHVFTPERLDRWLAQPSDTAASTPSAAQDDATRQTLLRRRSNQNGR